MNKAVFLDRDNTLIEDKGYVYKKEDLKWKVGAKEALEIFSKKGYTLIVVTNQSGVARGYYTEDEVVEFHENMNNDLFNIHGIKIDKFYYSPFHPSGIVVRYRKQSNCRKPGNALFKKAIEEFNISTSNSIAIGDNTTDLIPAVSLNFNKAYLIGNAINLKIEEPLKNKVTAVKNWNEIISDL